MEQILLAETRMTTTCTGENMALSYYLVCEPGMDGAWQYGAEIWAERPGETSRACVRGITILRGRIETLVRLLAGGTVTPVSLSDVVQDWL